MLLTRISVWNENLNHLLLPTTSIYMIHIPGSSYVLLSAIKADYKTYFFKVTVQHCTSFNTNYACLTLTATFSDL
jgi:hypothetical protein